MPNSPTPSSRKEVRLTSRLAFLSLVTHLLHPIGPLLQKDCAVCKDDFEISQKTIELPCKHSFHDDCILPWITQNGTCPVCRYELVPQPKHHGPNGNPPPSSSGGDSGPNGEAPAGSSANGGGGVSGGDGGSRSGLAGLLSSLNMRGGASQRSGQQQMSHEESEQPQHIPGAWAHDDLD